MNTLAIDAITPALSVSASGPKGTCTLSVINGGQHAPALLELIDAAVARAGFTPRQTQWIAVPEGPGSFTGLRLAWSAAKAISLAADCPIRAVPTLITYAAGFSSWPGPVVSVLDAKKSRFYAQIFRRGDVVTEPMDLSAAEFARYVAEGERILVTGPDAALFAEELSGANPLLDCYSLPSGVHGMSAELLLIAQSGYADYNETVPDHAGPIYVRRSDAEIEFSERNGQQ